MHPRALWVPLLPGNAADIDKLCAMSLLTWILPP